MKKRQEKNQELRVSPHSSVPLIYLGKNELKIRGEALKTQRQNKAAKITRLKEQVESQWMEIQMSNKHLNHLNKSLEYAQNSKAALGATIESGILKC